MKLIDRYLYLNRIISHLNRGMMLILVGQRRVGKSFILRLLRQWLETNRDKCSVLYINKEMRDFSNVKTARDLYNLVDETLPENGENYLLIDEVQDIEGYETALRSLYAEQRCQIIATGSNAYIFSTEISTRLAGRYIEIPVYSLSYTEFLEFHNLEDSDQSLLQYLKVGGLPGLIHYDIEDEGLLRDYLQSVFDTVMMRDVITREKIRNVVFLQNLSRFIADNTGKLISSSGISKFMKSQGEKISEPLITSYLNYLCNSLLTEKVSRFDIHGKKLFESLHKYYFTDHGLRNLLVGFNLIGSIEKVIENVIYNHLKIQGWEVAVGTLRAGEIDFVATRGNERIYIQATYLLSSEETIKREFGNLKSIHDDYPKMVVSMDPVSGELPQYPGIKHYRLRDFLKAILANPLI